MPNLDDIRDNIKEIMEPGSSPIRVIDKSDLKLVPGIEYHKAMLKSQSEFPDVKRSKTSPRGDKYASLGDVLTCLIPVLNKNGLNLKIETIYNERYDQCFLVKTIHGATGQGDEFLSLVPFAPQDFERKIAFQVYGTGFTYFKRYILGSYFCLYTDEDTDGDTEPKKKEPESKPKPYSAPRQSTMGSSGSGSSYFNN